MAGIGPGPAQRAVPMAKFYVKAIKTLAAHRGSSYISGWVAREKLLRKGI